MAIIEDFKVDILDAVLFPKTEKRWGSFLEKLAEEGLSDTTHYEEVSAETLENIYNLLWNVKVR